MRTVFAALILCFTATAQAGALIDSKALFQHSVTKGTKEGEL